MSSNFEWKTEEDDLWEESTPHNQPDPPRKRPWPIILIIIGLLLLAGFLLRQRVNQQLDASVQQVEDDILSTHNLLWRTAQNRDELLFKSLISGSDPAWAAVQTQLVKDGHFAQVPLLPWQATVPDIATSENVSITVAPTLTSAEITLNRVYTRTNPSGAKETLQFLQTAVYRRGRERWLLAPPRQMFWGEWDTERGEFVSIAYPERDADLAQSLTADLDQLVGSICSEMADLACPADLRLTIRFDDDVDRLLDGQTTSEKLNASLNMQLPAPSLIGVPRDDTSYDALFRLYGERVATAVITHLAGYDCCEGARLYQGLLDHQLAQLGLKPWPMTQAEYDLLFSESPNGSYLNLLANFIAQTDTEKRKLYAFVDYLESVVQPTYSLADLQKRFDDQLDLPALMAELANDSSSSPVSEAGFLQYIYDQTSSGQSKVPPAALPQSKIHLVCDQLNHGQTIIHELDLETEEWRELYRVEYEDGAWAHTSKNSARPNSFLTVLNSIPNGTAVYFLAEAGKVYPFDFDGGNPDAFYIGSDPDGRYLMMGQWQGEEEPLQFGLLDAETCKRGYCDWQPLAGYATWSPNGRNTLLHHGPVWTNNEEGFATDGWPLIYVGDKNGRFEQAVAEGIHPFWLDDDTIAFLQPDEVGTLQVVTAVISENRSQTVLTTDELLAQIPAEKRPESLKISWIGTSLDAPHRFSIRAEEQGETVRENHHFEVEITPTLTAVAQIEYLPTAAGNDQFLSPLDETFLLIYENGTDGNRVIVRNRETGQERVLTEAHNGFALDFSEDGDWYLLAEDDLLLLGSLDAAGYQQLIFHDFEECQRAYWLDEE